LSNRICLVTGAAQGFGLGIARGLADSGATVVLADLNLEGAQQAAERIDADVGTHRSFAVKGFGTVVTGAVLSGHISAGGTVRLFPGGRELRVRTLEAYGEERMDVSAGDRCALNLAGIEKQALNRGNMLTGTDLMRDTMIFYAKIRPAAFNKKILKAGEKVHLHTGTADCIASYYPAGGYYASFRLTAPIQLVRGDRFVVRDYSAKKTICGGTVLNPFPPRLKGRDRTACMELWDTDDMAALAEDILQRRPGPAHISEISENIGELPEKLMPMLEGSGRFRIIEGELFLEKRLRSAEVDVCSLLEAFHKSSPSEPGMEPETIRQQLNYRLPPTLFGDIMVSLVKGEKVEQSGGMLRLRGHGVRISPREQRLRDDIMEALHEKGYQTASEAVLTGNDRKKRACLQALVKEGAIVQLSKENYISSPLLKKAKNVALSHFEKNKAINVIEFKSLLETGRKGAILLLEYFDNIHFTVRRGDERLLLSRLKEESKPVQVKE